MSLSPVECHEQLDARGLLSESHGPGTYALEVLTPDTSEGVTRAWRDHADVLPDDSTMSRLTAERVAYVGASKQVYDRLMDHLEGDVRKATFLQVFDVVGLVGVWPTSGDPYAAEYNRAVELSQYGWTCWQDGEVV